MEATPGGENILTLNGSGTAYLFDGLNDVYTASNQLFNAPIQGYYGVLGAAQGAASLAQSRAYVRAVMSRALG